MESLSKYNQSVVNDKSNHHQQKPPKKSISNENNFNEPSQNGFSKYNDTEYNSKSLNSNLANIEYGKTIRLLRNGDAFYRGQKFVINSRKYKYFDVLMDDISNGLGSNFGAIRKIHTPNNGRRITSLDQLEDGKTYVAAGKQAFIKLNYHVISEGKRLPPNKLPALSRVEYHSISVPQYEEPQNATIFVYRNGESNLPSVKILLYKNTLASLDAVLNEISQKVKLQTGAVTKIFTMDGDQVVSSNQVVNGKFYVVSNREQKFKKCKYLHYEELFATPKIQKKPFKDLPPVRTTVSNQSSDSRLESSKVSHYQNLPNNKQSKKEDEDDFFIQKIRNRAHNLENKANNTINNNSNNLVNQQRLSNDLDEE